MNDTAVSAIPRHVHLVGIGGIHMSGIARILLSRGHIVTGSDLVTSPLTERLRQAGVTVHTGHRAGNVDDAGLVVYTSAAKAGNPELAEAQRRGIPAIKRGEMVARLMEGKTVIAVAGSHGKTTTTALVAHLLHSCGASPTFMVGGEVIDLGTNAEPGEGPHFVVEADEYDSAFLNYRPHVALVTNVEPDHLDLFGSLEKLQDAFRQFLSQVESNGYIVACQDSPALQACLPPRQALLPPTVGDDVNHPVHVVSYGLTAGADWTAEDISRKGIDASTFVVRYRKQLWGTVTTQLPGVHNVANTLGAIAVAELLGLQKSAVIDAIARFRGVHRRFEHVGDAAGVRVMDDYAHHPTEIAATLAAARERFADRRIVCLFQPHTYSRTAYLLEGFRDCFRNCDVLFICETYAAREEPAAGMSAERLAAEIRSPDATYTGGLAESARAIADALREGDVFFTIGAGDVEKVAPMVLDLLRGR